MLWRSVFRPLLAGAPYLFLSALTDLTQQTTTKLMNHLLTLSFAGVGTLFPVILQTMFIVATGVNSTEEEVPQNNTMSLYVLFGAAFLGILLGLISLIKLSRSGIYELFAGRDCAAHSPKNITLGSVPETAKRRYHAIKWCLFAEFSLSLVSYFVLSLVPYVHEATFLSSSSRSVTFWKGYLATVLISVFRVGDFLGGLLSHICCGEQRLDINVATFCYLSASILRLGFVFAAVLYTRAPFLLYHNLFMMALYSMLAFTNGSFSVAMALSCQSFMMGRRQDSCPIVSQFLWLSGVLGATIGVTLSFIQMTIWYQLSIFFLVATKFIMRIYIYVCCGSILSLVFIFLWFWVW